MNIKNILTFQNLVFFSSIGLSFCSACYSIVGISSLFSGASFSVAVMAGFLELSKIVSTSFLYRYWNKSTFLLKSYLITAVVVLMIITSLGIFGYLTGAYQQSAIENKITQDKIVIFEDQKKYSQDKIQTSKKRIENVTVLRNSQEFRLNESMTNILIARNPIQLRQIQQQTSDFIEQSQHDIENENQKIQKSIDEVQSFDKQISELKLQSGSKKDVQTFKFVADEFGVEINKVVKWFIIVIISVFDPLAVCLLLAYNTTLTPANVIKETESVDKIVEDAKKEATEEVQKETIFNDIIREVPVDRIVEKEVIREVPVDRIVEKEVIREVQSAPHKTGYFSF